MLHEGNKSGMLHEENKSAFSTLLYFDSLFGLSKPFLGL
jgi:hypothetical protein